MEKETQSDSLEAVSALHLSRGRGQELRGGADCRGPPPGLGGPSWSGQGWVAESGKHTTR